MNKAQLYNRSNVLQRRDAEQVIDEFGHLLRSSSCSTSASSNSSSDEDEELQSGVISEMSGETPRLLDIGTGSGDVLVDFVLPLFASDVQLVGSDISEEMVQFGRDYYRDLVEKVTFERLNIASDIQGFLKSQNGALFDHVTSFYCLHWVQDQLLAMRNIHSLLKENGNCLMAFIGKMKIFDIYEDMAQMRKWEKFMHDVS